MCGWTHKQTQRESPWVTPSWHFEFYGAFLPSFLWPLILICLVHSPWSFHVCNASLSQGGSYCKGIWVEHPLTLLPLSPAINLFCTCMFREVSWLHKKEIPGLGKAQPPPLIVLLFLTWKFPSVGNESPITLSWGRPIYLLPQYKDISDFFICKPSIEYTTKFKHMLNLLWPFCIVPGVMRQWHNKPCSTVLKEL